MTPPRISQGDRLLVGMVREMVENPGAHSEKERLDIIKLVADRLEHLVTEVEQLRVEIDHALKRKGTK